MKKSSGKPSWWKVALCGAIIGFINGIFGGGGGMLCVPFLENVLKMETKYAHATTLCVIFPLSVASSIVYIGRNNIEIQTLIIITISALLGGIIGAFLLKKLGSKWVRIIFLSLMFRAGLKRVI